MDKARVLRRLEKMDPIRKKKALKILDMDMNHCTRKHDIGMIAGIHGYPSLSDVTLVEIQAALKKGGAR